MVGIHTTQIRLAQGGYRIDTQTLAITAAKEVSADETIGMLLKCKQTVQHNRTISYYTLADLQKLTGSAKEHIVQSAGCQIPFLGSIVNAVRGTTRQLADIGALHQEIGQRLVAIAKEQQDAMTQLVLAAKQPEAQSQKIGEIAALFYRAHPSVRESVPFQDGYGCVTQNLVTMLSHFSDEVLVSWLLNATVHDPKLGWLKAFVSLSPSDTLTIKVLRTLQEIFPKCSFSDPKNRIPLALFLRMRGHIATIQPELSCLESVKFALTFLNIPKKPPTTFDWTPFLTTAHSLPLFARFIKETADASLIDSGYKTLLEEAVKIILLYDDEIEWLKELFKATQSYAVLECCVEPLKKLFPKEKMGEDDPRKTFKIMQRFWQLADIDMQKSKLSHAEMLRLAGFIELKFYPFDPLPTYFKKDKNGLDDHLPRSLQRQKITGDIFILLKKKNDFFETAEGLSKRATAAIRLPARTDQKAEIICQTVNKTKINSKYIDEKKTKKLQHEITLYHTFSRAPRGIWPLLGWDSYQIVVDNDLPITKISTFSHIGTSLHKFCPKKNTGESTIARLDLKENKAEARLLLTFMKDLAFGVEYMHDRSFLHGDLKPQNALVDTTEGTAKAGWIDFGSTFRPGIEQPRISIDRGIYGTIHYTAPELFGDFDYRGTFLPLDVWALGTIFYLLCTKTIPSWQLVMATLDKDAPDITEEIQTKVRQCVVDEVETPLSQQPAKTSSLFSKQIEHIILNMLRLDPNERWAISKVVGALDAIALT